ncbi:MAG: hypothetical protein LBU12_00405 [Deltaproteobacteria bacterium]|jgi:hypothetical protein|nr:hypothetical protein [Deltaproteobacteria bacterium]
MTCPQLKWLLLSTLAGLAGAALHGALAGAAARAQGSDVLTTGELRLIDGAGRARLALALVREKPRLLMLDSEGEYRLEMGLGETGEPHIWLRDADGAAKVQVALTAKGLPSFTLADQKGRVRAVVALSQEGEPTLLLRDPQGRDRVALWRDAQGAGLALADEEGRATAALNGPDGAAPSLTFYRDGSAYRSLP